ncbi:hypothetical protein GCM10011600_15160 [Pseudolysinimonas yzui]|uniref:Uncharacterized protein n=1 Tax=Pseudolysinimonas yzui TaxID=2708254 RepID=A0A8J3M0N6_9MICO|nr:hypothetical protein GCM10011600_15160 [Pseudolysinimonas yzui]
MLIEDVDVDDRMGKAGASEADAKHRLRRGVTSVADPVQRGESDGPAASAGVTSRELGQRIERGQAITMPDDAVSGGDQVFEADQTRKVAPRALGRRDRNPIEQRQLFIPHDQVVSHNARRPNGTAAVRVADVETWIDVGRQGKTPECGGCAVGEEAVVPEAWCVRRHSFIGCQGATQGAGAMEGAREIGMAGS